MWGGGAPAGAAGEPGFRHQHGQQNENGPTPEVLPGLRFLVAEGPLRCFGVGELLRGLPPSGGTGCLIFGESATEERPDGLLALVGYEPVALEQLVRHASRPVSQLLGELSELELAGKVTRVPGGYIRK